MNAAQVQRLCDLLALGRPLATPAPVGGGLLHQMWRLETERGVYAVKETAIRDVDGLPRPDMLGAARRAAEGERIARMLAAQGVPAVVALHAAPNPVTRLDPALDPVLPLGGPGHLMVLAYPWVEGAPLPATPTDPGHAARIGAVLGHIHALTPPPLNELPSPWAPPSVNLDHLLLLTRDAERLGLAWAADLCAQRPDMALWYARYRQVLPDLYRHQVVSHCDLELTNVLWPDAATPLLIDWEAAGMINPTVELAEVALNWSGATTGAPDPAAFAAVVAAYRAAGGRLADEPRDALYTVLINWLDWLRYALSQVIAGHTAIAESQGRTGLDPVERRRVQSEIEQHSKRVARFSRECVSTLAALARIAANLDLYASWLAR